MPRRVLLTAALSLVLAVFAGHGSLSGGIVHAAGAGGPVTAPFSCESTTYSPTSSGPYALTNCEVGEIDGPTGNALDTDDTGYQNEVGTTSYSGLECTGASIVTGQDYYNPTGWTEFDTYNPFTREYTVHAHCTVQTGDTGLTSNLFAYLYDTECDLQFIGQANRGDLALFGSDTNHGVVLGYFGSSQLYEAESPTGVVTLYCNGTFHRD